MKHAGTKGIQAQTFSQIKLKRSSPLKAIAIWQFTPWQSLTASVQLIRECQKHKHEVKTHTCTLPMRHSETVKNHDHLPASLLITEQQVRSLGSPWTEQQQ